MNARDATRLTDLRRRLDAYTETPLPGIAAKTHRDCLVRQFLESIRRVQYLEVMQSRASSDRADPRIHRFDPILGALALRDVDIEESFWLVFIATYFGRHRTAGWRLAQAVYGSLGGVPWTWGRVRAAPNKLEVWLGENGSAVTEQGGKFGNHRKYESKALAGGNRSFSGAVRTYVNWVGPPRTHRQLFALPSVDAGDAKSRFDALFNSMSEIESFGRTAKFDYLCTVSKARLADIEPGQLYLRNSTGPLEGAKLLFGANGKRRVSTDELDEMASCLAVALHLPMHVMEDALCNWQKSPGLFKAFRG